MMKRIPAIVHTGFALTLAPATPADEASDRVAAAGNAALGGSQAALFRLNQPLPDRETIAAGQARVAAAGNAALGGSQAALFRLNQPLTARGSTTEASR